MKRLHVNIQVKDVDKSVDFYNQLFKTEPTVQKPDYAKWMLEDPKVNFAISLSSTVEGIEHLGIQADTEEELQDLYQRLDSIEGKRLDEGDTVCCYAQSNKSWIEDPQKVSWEIFRTYGTSETNREVATEKSDCCASTCCAEQEVAVVENN